MDTEDPRAQSSGPSAEDLQRLSEYATALADAIESVLGPWVERSVERVYVQQLTRRPTEEVRDAAALAGATATAEIVPKLRALLALDIDEQRSGPLSLLRSAARFPTGVLLDAGVPGAVRDEFLQTQFPDDVYDLGPAAFADLDPSLHEPGLIWGAAKAHVHLARRRAMQ
jgi:hypothetical protein